MNNDRVSEPTPFYPATTPTTTDVERYIIEQFEELRGKRPRRVYIIHVPDDEVDARIYLDEVTEEDRLLAEKLERRMKEAGARVVFVVVQQPQSAAA